MFDTLAVPVCGCDRPEQVNTLMPVDEAVRRAHAMVKPMRGTELVVVSEAAGRTMAKAAHAPRPMPFFNNSAMDGFAIRTVDFDGSGPWILPIMGPIAAGASALLPLSVSPIAVRIFTGAPVPRGFDAVVMHEDVGVEEEGAVFQRCPQSGQNVRSAGEDIKRGAVLVTAGTQITAPHIGLLAANGYSAVNVVHKPRIGVFSTGDELVEAGQPLSDGQIYDANKPLLLSLANAAGADVTDLGIVADSLADTAAFINKVCGEFDLLLSSGAVSVGGHDFIKPALEQAGGKVAFWRVAMKPGKPVMFGQIGDTAIAGLPGNSLAAYLGFKLFVEGMIAKLADRAPSQFFADRAIAGFAWIRRTGRIEYFPVKVCGVNEVGVPIVDRLGHGGSASLNPLCQADGIAVVQAGDDRIQCGQALAWHPFCNSV